MKPRSSAQFAYVFRWDELVFRIFSLYLKPPNSGTTKHDITMEKKTEKEEKYMKELQDRYIRFDWAIKRLLRQKANFGVLEGFHR